MKKEQEMKVICSEERKVVVERKERQKDKEGVEIEDEKEVKG